MIARVAEFAGDDDFAVLFHFGPLLGGEGLQHSLDARVRAAAAIRDGPGSEHPDPALVEQPVEKPFRPDLRIGQFVVFHGLYQRTGLDPGLYRYRPAGHELALVTPGDVRALLAEAALDQAWVAEGAIDVVIAAVYARTTERYGERGVRYVHLEAGHAAENLCLQATALGLGAVTVGAFSDKELAAAVQLSDNQTPLYVIPVGRPTSP